MSDEHEPASEPNDAPYIELLEVENFGCLKNVSAKLSRLHAFVGPNDSGKSTLLKAVSCVFSFAGGNQNAASDLLLNSVVVPSKLSVKMPDSAHKDRIQYQIHSVVDGARLERRQTVTIGNQSKETPLDLAVYVGRRVATGVLQIRTESPQCAKFLIGDWKLLHLSPSAYRSSTLFNGTEPIMVQDDGSRLAAVCDAIIGRGDDAWPIITKRIRELFPTVKRLGLKPDSNSNSMKSFEIELWSGEIVPASLISHGLFLYLTYAVLEHLAPLSMLLIEEPENGLHPARIKEVMDVLRHLSKHTQVLIATHSPLVLNELEGHEISVVTRTKEAGTKVTLLKDTPNFEERSEVYALGELWLSYCNGVDEAPLFATPAKHAAE